MSCAIRWQNCSNPISPSQTLLNNEEDAIGDKAVNTDNAMKPENGDRESSPGQMEIYWDSKWSKEEFVPMFLRISKSFLIRNPSQFQIRIVIINTISNQGYHYELKWEQTEPHNCNFYNSSLTSYSESELWITPD